MSGLWSEVEPDLYRYKIDSHSESKQLFFSLIGSVSALNFEYRAYCSTIVMLLKDDKLAEEALGKLFFNALVINHLLLQIYACLDDETSKLEHTMLEKAILSQLFEAYQSKSRVDLDPMLKRAMKFSWIDKVREETTEKDVWRRLLGRLQRALNLWVPLLNVDVSWISSLGSGLQFFSKFLNLLFFLPRIFTNLFFLLHCLIPGYWMSPEARSIPWQTRLYTYLSIDSRGVTLMGDFAVVSTAGLSCFFFIGSLSFCSAYLVIALQITEFLLSCIASFLDTNRFERVTSRSCYGRFFKRLEPEEAVSGVFHSSMEREIAERRLSVVVRGALVLCSLTLLPSFAVLSPWVPFLGAVASFILTLTRSPWVKAYILPPKFNSNLFELEEVDFSENSAGVFSR